MNPEQFSLFDAPVAAASWQLRRSDRARRLSARVSMTGRVEVVAPQRASERAIHDFVTRYRDWIERHAARARERSPVAQPFPPANLELPALATRWRVHLGGGTGNPRVTAGSGNLLTIFGALSGPAEQKLLAAALRRWLARQALAHLTPQLEALASSCGFQFRRVSLRCQRTRWGSCSARSTISLNICLLFQRPEVVRYLMLHELSHTRHMNHSSRFWDCVARECPDYRALDRELLRGWERVPSWVFGV